ncbi:hypothetical protein Y032_0072g639 [Ancylostoma ceylanicum]|uniref:Reverse transcriptase domain-containing protein n=1 Tax=Ancylostoma ceylanicum TaxID=53326 RepID=A0A016TXB7_9BILA|nr:hypothetical protein Y032_0072g639 [Ancylostoma ceylanicum]
MCSLPLSQFFSRLLYQKNHEVQRDVAKLKTAPLEAAMADRKRRKSSCTLSIVTTKSKLQSHIDPKVWKSISAFNQRVCTQLRNQEHLRLEKKLEHLRTKAQPHVGSSFMKMNSVPPKRHTVVGTNEVDSDMAAALNLGPSFAVAPKVNNAIVDKALCGVHQFAHRLRWRLQKGAPVLDRQSALLSSMPFPARGIKLSKAAPEVDLRLASLEIAIQRVYLSEATRTYRSNVTTSERRGISKLLRLKNRLRYTVGDKCGFFVVMPQSMDKAITKKVLSDSTIYRETTMAAFTKTCEEVIQAITTVVRPRLGVAAARQPLDLHPIVPTFYNLVKMHKLTSATDLSTIGPDDIRTRPIISSCGGPSDRLSWLLVKVLSPLLQFVGAHIVNVDDFLASLSQCKIPSTASYASFDGTSLYTNVNNNNAVDAVISLYQQHQSQIPSMGFNANEIKIMLDAVLACNIFCFNDKIFEQRRGLAMGNRIAPLLAIIFLDHIERMLTSLTFVNI